MVTYEGGTYVVNTAPPTGTPDAITETIRYWRLCRATGVTGATGVRAIQGDWSHRTNRVRLELESQCLIQRKSPNVSVGQVVTYEGGTYVVNTAPPTGTPDTSPRLYVIG
ncbi:hypothetical protein ACEQPO_05675 [Bacillus sp. SL00103]